MAKKAVNSWSKVCVYKSALKGGCLSSVVRLGQRVVQPFSTHWRKVFNVSCAVPEILA